MTTKKNSLNIFLLSGSFLYLVLTLNFEIKKFLLITFVVFSFIFFTFRKENSFYFHVIFQTLINIFAYILYQKIDLAIITLSFVLINIYLFKSDKFASELDYRGYPNFLKSSWTGIFMLFILTVLTQNVYLNFEFTIYKTLVQWTNIFSIKKVDYLPIDFLLREQVIVFYSL